MELQSTVQNTAGAHRHRLRSAEAERLEALWSGSFGQAYTRRNGLQRENAGVFHHALCRRLGVRTVLEVGCNVGLNLARIAADETIEATGVDVNREALAIARQRTPLCQFAHGSAYALPFASESFDLVFTCGLLIHLPLNDLPTALQEIERTSRQYIWCGEYYSAVREEVLYRGQRGALFKDDFGRRLRELFPEVGLLETGFLDQADSGFDDITWWLFGKDPVRTGLSNAPASKAS